MTLLVVLIAVFVAIGSSVGIVVITLSMTFMYAWSLRSASV